MCQAKGFGVFRFEVVCCPQFQENGKIFVKFSDTNYNGTSYTNTYKCIFAFVSIIVMSTISVLVYIVADQTMQKNF